MRRTSSEAAHDRHRQGSASRRPIRQATPRGVLVAGASCFMWLHTHSADGIIHTESPVNRVCALGAFFDLWGQPLDRLHVGPARGPVVALFNRRAPSPATHGGFRPSSTLRSSSK
jgi:hypothetical protein